MKISKGKISTVIYCDCGRQHGSIHGKDDRKEIVCACRRKYENLGPNGWALKYPDNPCPWKFKSPECGYTGGASSDCGKSFEDCQALEHEECFGGFPGMPETPPYKKPTLEIKINTTKFEKALKKASKAVKEFSEEVERATWSPKVGEWVWAKGNTSSAEKPRKITETNHLGYKGCYASEDADGGVGNIDAHLGDMIRPLRLEEVSSVEMARQFFGRIALCHTEGPYKGMQGIIKNWDDKMPEHEGELFPWAVVFPLSFKSIWCRSKKLTLLPKAAKGGVLNPASSVVIGTDDGEPERILPLVRDDDGTLGVKIPKESISERRERWKEILDDHVHGTGILLDEALKPPSIEEIYKATGISVSIGEEATYKPTEKTKIPEAFPEGIYRRVKGCSACGNDHAGVGFNKYGENDYRGICPKTGAILGMQYVEPRSRDSKALRKVRLISKPTTAEEADQIAVELYGITKPARKVVEKLKAQEKREEVMEKQPGRYWFKCPHVYLMKDKTGKLVPGNKSKMCEHVFEAHLGEAWMDRPLCPNCRGKVDEDDIVEKPVSRIRRAAGWLKKKARACVARPAGLAYRLGSCPFRFWFGSGEETCTIDSITYLGNDPQIEIGTGPLYIKDEINQLQFGVGDEVVFGGQPCRAKRAALWLSRKALYLPWKAWRAGRWTALSGFSLASALVPVRFAKWAAWEICKLWALLLLIGAVAGAAVFATIYALRIAGAL